MPAPLVIAPRGELDLVTVDGFRAELAEAVGQADRGVVVDLSEVSFIDSTGLGALVEAYNRLRRRRGQLTVVAPAGSVAAVLLNLSGLSARLPVLEARPPLGE